MESEEQDVQGGEVEPVISWEARYVPIPRAVGELGFEEILTRISEVVYASPPPEPLRRWGDVGLYGRLQRVVSFDIAEPQAGTLAEFQDDVGRFVAGLGLEGDVVVQRVVTTMRTPVCHDEDEG